MRAGRAPVRPAVATLVFMAGLVLVLLVLRRTSLVGRSTDRDFVQGQEFGVWLVVAAASVVVWLVVLVRGIGVLRTLLARPPQQLRRSGLKDWGVSAAALVAIAAAVVVVLGSSDRDAPRVPVENWEAIVWTLLGLAGLSAAPWVIAVWTTHEQLKHMKSRISSLTAPGAAADAEIEQLRTSWWFIERAVLFLLAIVLSATLMTGALRAALVPEKVDEAAFPASDVILYGAFFAFLIAIVVLPLVASWRSKAPLLVDRICPLTSTMTEADAGLRARLGAALNLDVSMFRSPLTVLGVLSPFLTAVLAVFVPQLAE